MTDMTMLADLLERATKGHGKWWASDTMARAG